MIGSQLGYEVARYVFGPAAERERRVAEDLQVREAVTLLRGTTSPQALLGMAGRARRRFTDPRPVRRPALRT